MLTALKPGTQLWLLADIGCQHLTPIQAPLIGTVPMKCCIETYLEDCHEATAVYILEMQYTLMGKIRQISLML